MSHIVDIICSSPAMNTCSQKWNIPHLNPTLWNNEGALDIHSLFLHPPQYYGWPWDSPRDTKQFHHIQSTWSIWRRWRSIKKKNARVRHMRKIRRRAELMVQLKRELRQTHKLSRTESGFPGGIWDIGIEHWVWKSKRRNLQLHHFTLKSRVPPHQTYNTLHLHHFWLPHHTTTPLIPMTSKTGET